MKRNAIALSATLFAASLAQAATPVASSLKIFTGGNAVAYDVSADGKTVVGTSNGTIFMWNATTDTLTDIGGTAVGTAAVAGRVLVSADGSRVAGSTLNSATGKYEASYYDTSTSTWTRLGGLGGASSTNPNASQSWGMSSDGRYIVGSSYTAVGNYNHAAIFDTQTGAKIDVGAAGNVQSRIYDISTDGKVASGFSTSSRNGAIWRDTDGDGSYVQTTIRHPVGGGNTNETTALSDNGLWAAGASFNTALPYLVNTSSGAVTTFAKLPIDDGSASHKSTAVPGAISDDGQVIIGTHSIGGLLNTNHGFIWTAGSGVMDLDDFLAGWGIDTANAYNFVSPMSMAITGNSTTITGIAARISDNSAVGFAVTIPTAVPEPSTYTMLLAGFGVLGFMARRRRVS